MRAIKLSWKSAQRLLGLAHNSDGYGKEAAELESAMKVKKFVALAKGRRLAKRLTKKQETEKIRSALIRRSKGLCELCGGVATDMHHALSRRVPQSAANCLFVCRDCHRGITGNRPSATYWLNVQAEAFGALDINSTRKTILDRLEYLETMAEASRVGEGAP